MTKKEVARREGGREVKNYTLLVAYYFGQPYFKADKQFDWLKENSETKFILKMKIWMFVIL